jgi:stage V sporulation protein B
MPRLIKARDNVDNLNKIISDELNASYFIFVPLTFGVIVYSEEILKLLFADKGVYIGSRLLICLMLSLFFLIPLYIINCALEAVGKVNAPMVSMLIAAIFKTITGCVLIGNPKFGIFGASISTIVFYCIAFLVSYVAAYKSNAIMLPVLKSAVKPIINSFISIYMIYAVYLYTSTKINWIFSFMISVVLTIALYFTLHLLQRNTKCGRYSKLLNTQIN